MNEEKQNDKYADRNRRERVAGWVKRSLALAGIVAVAGGAATANAASSKRGAEARGAKTYLVATKSHQSGAEALSRDPSRAQKREQEIVLKLIYQTADELKSLIESNKPVMFYGGIGITPKEGSSDIPTIVFLSTEKDYKRRLWHPQGGDSYLLVDPLGAMINGKPYAITFDRGGRDDSENNNISQTDFSHRQDNKTIGMYLLIDLEYAAKVADVTYYGFGGQNPRMLKVKPMHNIVTPVGVGTNLFSGQTLGFYNQFGPELFLPTFQERLSGFGLEPLPRGYSPPFIKK